MNLLELPFFSGFTAQELRLLRSLGCMRTDRFPHGALILRAGSRTREMGIVVSGCVHIESSDFWGTHSILSSVEAGGVFAETYALCGEALMVDAVAAKDCEILFLQSPAFLPVTLQMNTKRYLFFPLSAPPDKFSNIETIGYIRRENLFLPFQVKFRMFFGKPSGVFLILCPADRTGAVH